MYKVKVKGVGVKLAGKWSFKGDVVEITSEEYEKNKEYVDVIEVIEEKIIAPENPETGKELNNKDDNENTEKGMNDGGNDEEENTREGTNNVNSDVELDKLKAEAEKLGIKVTHNMKKETIIDKIEKAKTTLSNPEGE